MRLTFNPDTLTLSVKLELGGAVALDGPELWQFNGQTYNKLPNPQQPNQQPPNSEATWSNVPRVGPNGLVMLQLHWDAFEPTKPKWRYPAKVTVTDEGGRRLKGRDGHVNPTVLPCDIGDEALHEGHERLFIGIAP